jgi:hypothetical protein
MRNLLIVLLTKYYSIIKWRRITYTKRVACMGENKNAYWVFVGGGEPEGKILFGRPRCRWGDNVKLDNEETG